MTSLIGNLVWAVLRGCLLGLNAFLITTYLASYHGWPPHLYLWPVAVWGAWNLARDCQIVAFRYVLKKR
jgi:hypothetical protein